MIKYKEAIKLIPAMMFLALFLAVMHLFSADLRKITMTLIKDTIRGEK
jgi:hypothetical protein